MNIGDIAHDFTIQQRDEMYETKLAALRGDVQEGLDDIEAGNVYDGDEVMKEMTALLKRKQNRNG